MASPEMQIANAHLLCAASRGGVAEVNIAAQLEEQTDAGRSSRSPVS